MAGTTFAGSNLLLCNVFIIEFLAVCFGCLVLTSTGCSVVAGVVIGIDGDLKRAVSPLYILLIWSIRLSVVYELVSCCPVCACFVVTLVLVQLLLPSRRPVSLGRGDL